jgi:hypothetical protein
MRARAFHGLTAAVALTALVLQLVLVMQGHQHLGEAEGSVGRPDLDVRLVRFASYLTIWFNALVAGTSLTLAIDPERDGRVWRALRLDALVIAVGGGIVHWVALRPLLDLDGADLVADKLLHVAVPILVLFGWLAYGPRPRIDTRDVAAFLVVPVGWLVYTLVRGAFVDWYPYPFIDVGEHGYPTVLLTSLVIAALMLGLAWGARQLDTRLRPTPRLTA